MSLNVEKSAVIEPKTTLGKILKSGPFRIPFGDTPGTAGNPPALPRPSKSVVSRKLTAIFLHMITESVLARTLLAKAGGVVQGVHDRARPF